MSEKAPALKPAQERALLALLAGKTFEAVAAEVGVDRSTLRRWRALPTFQAAMDAERRRLVLAATDRLRLAGIEAVDALRDVLASADAPAAVKVQAASAVLSHLIRAVESDDLYARLDALEAKADEPQRY